MTSQDMLPFTPDLLDTFTAPDLLHEESVTF